MILKGPHVQYLKLRGYTDDLLREDKPYSVFGKLRSHEIELNHPTGAIAWDVLSMSDTFLGILVRELEEKKYRWAQAQGAEFIPNWMGSTKDHKLLYETGAVIITEGIFDRIAIKRLWPTKVAVFARQSKGVGKVLETHLRRYATRLLTMFDNDEPGEEGTSTIAKLFPNAESLQLPAKDPAEFLEKFGEVRARILLKERIRQLNDDLS